MRQIGISLATERSAAKDEFVCADSETPPVNWVCVATFGKDLWSHVGHTSSDSSEHAPLSKVDSNVKIGEMGMTAFVQENIVRFDITYG